MPEVMKKLHTDRIQLTFAGPIRNKTKAVEALMALGFEDTSDLISWREAFPDHNADNEQGICLSGARARENITQKELSRLTGIPQRHISEMENGKRTIGRKNAQKLAKVLNVNYKVFL